MEGERKEQRGSPTSGRGPLEGLRVLDIGTALAGPFGATLLGDFGAEVIKVENPAGGDNLRHLAPYYNGGSLWWASDARNKKSITADLRTPEGQEVVKRLVRISDVLIENYRPGTLERWNLGYEELKRINERIIVIRVSGFGQTGPYRNRPGFDTVGAAFGGLTYLTREPGGIPYKAGYAVCDYLTGVFNALAALIALYYRDGRKTGRGQWADVALYESPFRIQFWTAAAYDKMGIIREPMGNRSPSSAPMDHFFTKDDKWAVIIVVGDGLFGRFARAIGREDLLEDPRCATQIARSENRDLINDLTARWTREHTLEEVMETLVAAGVPVSPIYSIADIFQDPHYQARGSILDLDDPLWGRIALPAVTPRLSRTPGTVRHAGPSLGQHNREILGELLGYGEEEIAGLSQPSREGPAGASSPAPVPSPASIHPSTGATDQQIGPPDLTTDLPLKGVRILDLSRYLAGPLGGTLLADFGAEVIQVELTGEGDNIRTVYPLYQGTSLGWVTTARNKKSITLNLKTAEGQSLARRLVAASDVVLENFRPGTLERWNLGYEELRRVNPRIILVRVSGFGQDGPYKDRASFDTIGSAAGGLTYLTGSPDGPPLRTGLGVCDCLTGMLNALGILLALYDRDAQETGEGQVVDVAQYEAIFRISEFSAAAFQKLGMVRERSGNRHPSAAPVNHYRTRDDQWVVVLAHRDNLFARLVRAMGKEELLQDPRFSMVPQRVAHADALDGIVEEWMAHHTLSEVMEALVTAQVPVSPIYNIADIFQDPHYQARGNLVQVEESAVGPVKLPAATPRLSLTPGRVRWGGPRLGQHNEEVYRDLLGIAPEELERLREVGII